MAQPTTCPDRGVLARFASGQLSAAERAPIEQHLSQCPACADAVRALPSVDSQQQTLNSEDPTPSAELTTPLDPSELQNLSPARSAAPSFLAPAQKPDEIGRLA